MCSNAKKRKRLAGVGAALDAEIRSRDGIKFTADAAWAVKVSRDRNWFDLFARLISPSEGSHIDSTYDTSAQLLEFQPVRERHAIAAFDCNGCSQARPPADASAGFERLRAPTLAASSKAPPLLQGSEFPAISAAKS